MFLPALALLLLSQESVRNQLEFVAAGAIECAAPCLGGQFYGVAVTLSSTLFLMGLLCAVVRTRTTKSMFKSRLPLAAALTTLWLLKNRLLPRLASKHVPSVVEVGDWVTASDNFTVLFTGISALFLTRVILLRRVVPSIDVPLTEAEAVTGYDYFGPATDMELVIDSEPDRLQCYDPATAQHLGSVPIVPAQEVVRRIAAAKAAQKEWAKSSFEERRHVLRILLKYILDHQDDIVRVAVRDSGKTMLGASFGEILPSCEKIQWVIDSGEEVLEPESRAAARLMLHKKAWVEYHPVGVLGVIAPFNYPFHNLINHVISGLFAGNAVVTKASEHTSWSSDYYNRIFREALTAAGGHASPDLVQVVTGFGATGSALVSGGVDKIIFTGSTKVGKLVMANAAKRVTPCVLELGGKDVFVVMDDANLGDVFKLLMRGCFQNCGQNCIGVERVYVQRSVYDTFISMAEPRVRGLRQGRPLSGTCDMGATTMPGQLAMIEELVADAVANGARVLVGGGRNEQLGPGLFFEPTLIVDAHHGMRITQDEAFGPLMVVIPFDDEEELIGYANDSEFGLASSIYSGSYSRAHRLAEQLQAGMSNVNDYGVNYLIQSLPFGGVKLSGFGRFAGVEGLRECCVVKSVTSDRFPLVSTAKILPPLLDYPVGDRAVPFHEGLVRMFYGLSWIEKIGGLGHLLWNLVKSC